MNHEATKALRELMAVDAALLDMHDREEWNPESKWYRNPGPTFQKFSERLSAATVAVEKAFLNDDQVVLNSKRWDVLFNTEGLRFELKGGKWCLFVDYIRITGGVSGSKYLFSAESLPALADKYLGLVD